MIENRALWRILRLCERNVDEIKSVVDHFDEQSGSTLEETSYTVKEEESQLDQLTGSISSPVDLSAFSTSPTKSLTDRPFELSGHSQDHYF